MWEAIETPRPAAWRVIFKGLTLLEHLVKNGSERCVDDARNHSHMLRNLDRFNYYEGTIDRGIGVREKSKQIVEILQDDERIREERMKAKQLREKFAGRSTASNSGGGGGGKYAGYGNSDANWNGGGGGGGSRGYAEGGIRSGRDSNRDYAGRYGEGGLDSAPSTKAGRSSPAVTAKKSSKSTSASGTKVKKVKKKEKKAEAPAAAPEVDLFGFDDAAPAPTAPANGQFDAFQNASVAPPPVAAPTPAGNDDFGDFQQIAPSSAVQFDAFGAAPAQQQSFDAFGAAPVQQQQPVNAMNNAFGNMTMSPTPTATNNAAPPNNNDDFGDFEDADPSSAASPQKSSDPLSKLISLDGLSKNVKKETTSNQQPLDSLGHTGGMMGGQQQGFQVQPVLGKGQEGEFCLGQSSDMSYLCASLWVRSATVLSNCSTTSISLPRRYR